MSGKKNIHQKQESNNRHSYIGFGIAFGLLGGAVFSSIIGMLFKFPLIWAFGPGFGFMIGIVIGSIMDANQKRQ